MNPSLELTASTRRILEMTPEQGSTGRSEQGDKVRRKSSLKKKLLIEQETEKRGSYGGLGLLLPWVSFLEQFFRHSLLEKMTTQTPLPEAANVTGAS